MLDSSNVIQLLSDHEEAIGNLYGEYAKVFQDQRDFWTQFSKEEFQHAEWVRSLQALLEKGEVIFSERFHEAAIQTSLKFISRQIERAKEGNVTLIEALSVSLSIETSLLEKKFFDVFTGDSIKVQKIKRSLVDETKRHRKAMQEAWDRNRAI